jgi:hypothetical protein
MDLRIPITDKIFLGIAVACGVMFGINYAYLVQRNWDGLYALPLWLILLDIALVAGPMRENKMTAYIGLLCAACFVEYQHMQAAKKDVDQFYFVMLALLIYGSSLLFFQLMLFGKLNRLEVDNQTISADLKALTEEAKRLNLSIEKTIRGEGDTGAAASSNYSLYRRALSELFPVKSRKDVPGYLTRTLREGFGMDRGVVLEVPESGEAAVREMWGDGLSRTGAAMAAFKVPPGLVDMVREKSGAVLESELVGEGPHQDDIAAMAATGFEPVAMFPLMVREAGGQQGDERPSWLVLAVRPVAKKTGTEESDEPPVNTSGSGVVKGLRILPIQSVLDIAGQFVSRASLK